MKNELLDVVRCLALLAACLQGGGAIAASLYYTGDAGDNQWRTPGNWKTGVLPTAADDVRLPGTLNGSTAYEVHPSFVFLNGEKTNVHFGGPSDRTFQGPFVGRDFTVTDGTGTLTLAGPDIRRSGAHYCYSGTTVLAREKTPAPTIITNSAVCYVADGIAHSPKTESPFKRTASFAWKDSALPRPERFC